LLLALLLGLRAARGEEVALELVQVAFVAGDPIERRGEPCAAVELAAVTRSLLPVARRTGQVLVQAAALRVLLEPAAQSRPFAQQRLVRDLEGLVLCGDEPAAVERSRLRQP
jgi:hypothetical protein